MAGQEDLKNAGAGQTPAPVKLHTSGLAGATQHLTPPTDSADRTATVPIAKSASGGKPMPKPQSSVVPEAHAAGLDASLQAGDNDKTMRLKRNTAAAVNPAPQVPPTPASDVVSPSSPTIKLAPQAPASPVMPSSSQTIKLASLQPSSSLLSPSAQTIKMSTPQPSSLPSPAAQTIKLTPSAASSASPTIKLAPSAAPSASQTIKLAPSAAPSAAQTIKLTPPAASSAAQTVKLTPSASQTIKLTSPAAPSAAQTIKLTPSAAPSASQTIKLTSSVAPSAAPAIKLTPSAAPSASPTIKMAGSDEAEAHTVKISRVPRSGQGLAPFPAPSSSATPPSSIPGAKQTIKLRPSSMSSTMGGIPPAGGQVKLNAGAAGKTIKLVPLSSGGAKVVQNGPAAPTQQVPVSAPAQPQQKTAASSAPAGQGSVPPRVNQTLKLTPAAGKAPASTAGGKPAGGKTMKLTLHKPVGAPAPGNEAPKVSEPALSSSTEAKKDEASAAAVEQKPSVVFLVISIAAMLAVAFTVLLMSVQFANMYHGADVNIPGMTRLSGNR